MRGFTLITPKDKTKKQKLKKIKITGVLQRGGKTFPYNPKSEKLKNKYKDKDQFRKICFLVRMIFLSLILTNFKRVHILRLIKT